MLDLKFVCDNIETVEKKLKLRNSKVDLTEVISLAAERRSTIKESEALKARKNAVSAQIAVMKRNKENADALIAEMKEEGEKIKALDERLAEVEARLNELMYTIPNLIDDSVPYGTDSSENVEVRRFSEPRAFDFEPLPHWDIGDNLGILSAADAAKITGARFTVYRGLGARLERSVINFMLDTHTANGYTEVFTPFMVNRDSMYGTGQLPKFEEDMFAVKNTNYFLIPTAEVPVTNLHRGEILKASDLTIKYCAYSACFRAEAGSAGRDTRGLIRQHQFNKVELVKFAHPDKSWEELETLTRDAERILQLLKLPYRVVCLCSGDIGFSSAKTYDIEVYMPSYGRYVEISSCSNFVDFQARRAGIKFRDEDGRVKLAHTLNGSGLAVGRTVAAILENYQNADGSVTVPEALRPYMGVDIIK
ncbi:MAG: serine--tRNA ligase [Clostridiales bacterium]|jgi:seryl-tRNA synthetase|nr:serine--tRNA ligase [Clostridiales bacterium]HOK82491.1 serine--tRNA ligase [Clostridia bacterium]HOL61620.1 serine--tRNA ligase [Clostridia bacterium]HPO54260.1 serine--tRNA ligase [Clostridia bacterium]